MTRGRKTEKTGERGRERERERDKDKERKLERERKRERERERETYLVLSSFFNLDSSFLSAGREDVVFFFSFTERDREERE